MKKTVALFLLLILTAALISCRTPDVEASGSGDPSTTASESGRTKSEKTVSEALQDVDFDIRSDEETVVWQIGSTRYIYYHDGKNITGYETLLDMKTPEAAAKYCQTVRNNGLDSVNADLEDVSVEGQYVRFRYKLSAVTFDSYEELKQYADQFQSILG